MFHACINAYEIVQQNLDAFEASFLELEAVLGCQNNAKQLLLSNIHLLTPLLNFLGANKPYLLVRYTCVMPPCKFCFQVPPYRLYPLIVEPTPRPDSPIIMVGFGFLLDNSSTTGSDGSSMNKDAH